MTVWKVNKANIEIAFRSGSFTKHPQMLNNWETSSYPNQTHNPCWQGREESASSLLANFWVNRSGSENTKLNTVMQVKGYKIRGQNQNQIYAGFSSIVCFHCRATRHKQPTRFLIAQVAYKCAKWHPNQISRLQPDWAHLTNYMNLDNIHTFSMVFFMVVLLYPSWLQTLNMAQWNPDLKGPDWGPRNNHWCVFLSCGFILVFNVVFQSRMERSFSISKGVADLTFQSITKNGAFCNIQTGVDKGRFFLIGTFKFLEDDLIKVRVCEELKSYTKLADQPVCGLVPAAVIMINKQKIQAFLLFVIQNLGMHGTNQCTWLTSKNSCLCVVK